MRGVATLSFSPPALVPYEHTRYSFGSSWTNTVRVLLRLLHRRPRFLLSKSISSSSGFRIHFSFAPVWISRTLSPLPSHWDTRRAPPSLRRRFLVLLIFSDLYEPRGRTRSGRADCSQVETGGIVNFYPLPSFFLHSEIRRFFTNDFRGNSAGESLNPPFWIDEPPRDFTTKCTSREITPEIARLL